MSLERKQEEEQDILQDWWMYVRGRHRGVERSSKRKQKARPRITVTTTKAYRLYKRDEWGKKQKVTVQRVMSTGKRQKTRLIKGVKRRRAIVDDSDEEKGRPEDDRRNKRTKQGPEDTEQDRTVQYDADIQYTGTRDARVIHL